MLSDHSLTMTTTAITTISAATTTTTTTLFLLLYFFVRILQIKKKKKARIKEAIIHILFICWTFHVLACTLYLYIGRFERTLADSFIHRNRMRVCGVRLHCCFRFHVGCESTKSKTKPERERRNNHRKKTTELHTRWNGNGNAFSTFLAYAWFASHILLVAIAPNIFKCVFFIGEMLNAQFDSHAVLRSIYAGLIRWWYCVCISKHGLSLALDYFCFAILFYNSLLSFYRRLWRFTISTHHVDDATDLKTNFSMHKCGNSHIQLFMYQLRSKTTI